MAITLNPPPLEVPEQFAREKSMAAFFASLINVIYQMWTALYAIRSTARTLTTDATTTGVVQIPIQTDRTMMVEATIVARRTGESSGANGDSAWYKMTGAYKNIGGVLTLIGSVNLVQGENQAGWNVGLQTAGSSLVVVVLGAANNNITWESTISTYTVGA